MLLVLQKATAENPRRLHSTQLSVLPVSACQCMSYGGEATGSCNWDPSADAERVHSTHMFIMVQAHLLKAIRLQAARGQHYFSQAKCLWQLHGLGGV